MEYSLPGECYQAFLTVDDVPAETLTFGTGTVPFQVTGSGTTFGVALTANDACSMNNQAAFVEVTRVRSRRGGWWTSPSGAYAGIRDTREGDCGIGFENLKWWGMLENKAFGTLLVHRSLKTPVTGIRFSYDHTFEGPFFKLRLLLDGKPMKDLPLQTPSQKTEEISGRSFREVGFQFAVAANEAFAYKWGASIVDIEVLSPDQGWVSICEAEEARWDFLETGDVLGPGDGGGLDEGDQSKDGGARSGGCAAGRGPAPRAALLVLLLALLFLFRRHPTRSVRR